MAAGGMTTLHLVRHAAHGLLGHVLTGRMPGVLLGEEGRRQAGLLAARFSRETISAVWASPLERARETAQPVAAASGLGVEIIPDLNEIEIGSWTGRSFEDLAKDPVWTRWNSARSVTRAPGGETMLEVQARAVAVTERARRAYPNGSLVLVSHGDVLKSVVAYYLGLSLDAILRFEIGPASISTVQVGDWGFRLDCLNQSVG